MLDTPSGFSRRDAVKLTAVLLGILLGSAVCVGFVIGMVTAVYQVLREPAPAWADSRNPGITLLINLLTFTLTIGFALHRLRARWRQFLRVRMGAATAFLAVALTMAGFVIVISEVSNVVERLLPTPAALRTLFAPFHDLARYPIAATLTLVVMAPVTEELFFRGLLLRRLLPVTTPSRAVWTSAVLFMAFHLNPWQFPTALAMGLLCGWIYVRTRALGLCIFAHALNNATVLIARGLPFTVRGFNADTVSTGQFQPWWFDLVGLAIVIAGGACFLRVTVPVNLAPAPLPATPALARMAEDR